MFSRSMRLSSVLYGVALFSFATFCACDVLKTTPRVVTDTPKQCSFKDVKKDVGENWNPFLRPQGYFRCIRCTCKLAKDGSLAIIDCTRCVKLTKEGQHPEEGEKNCKSENVTRKHGTVWAVAAMGSVPLRKNQCTECSCTDGFVTCSVRSCPVLSCKKQRNGTQSCCPVCEGDLQTTRDPAGCKTMGRYYGNLEKWFPLLSPKNDLCVSCVCKNTSVVCQRPTCPTLSCVSPVRKPGACCDTCPVTPESGCLLPDNQRVPYNYSYHPNVVPFGITYCILCVCIPPNIDCSPVHCPSNYSCAQPVTVPGKCCKECKGTNTTMKPAVRRYCQGKHWRVYEYEMIQRRNQNLRTEIRVHFAFVDGERNFVEIHSLVANTTNKTVTVTNTTKRNFDQINQNSNYIHLGKIREVQIVKLRDNEKRPCHNSHGCVHTVRKIANRLRGRVSNCVSRGPPDILKMLESTPTEPGT